jgi:4-amino-4-deoxy-L-arabinose transferase-like glycosyltransferase
VRRPLGESSSPLPTSSWRWPSIAAFLILTVTGLRVLYLAWACPLDLSPDEAHYWDWSRHLDWSYYSKGPLVAYLIRAGCLLVGPWSQQATGTEMLAVRLPAVLCGALLLVSLYVLTVQVFRREDLACGVIVVALTLPITAAGAALMTIDAPYTCCWGWALVFGYHAIFRGAHWAWPVTGLLVGLGILAKYTMVLWLPSAALFLLTSRQFRFLLCQPGFWIMVMISAGSCLPILVWNHNHDWLSVRHVTRQAGINSGPSFFWKGPLIFLGTQCALYLGFWFLVWLAAVWAHRPWREANPSLRYLWWLSVPMVVVFLLFSVKTGGGEPNWPVTAYLSGLVLSAGWLVQRWQRATFLTRRWMMASLTAFCILGLIGSLLLYRTDLVYPVLKQLAGPETVARPMPLRRWDPTCRLRGWRTLATAVDQMCHQLREEGIEPVLAGTGWALPGEIGFYCRGHPVVYSVGPVLGDRCSQYDLWRPNPLDDGQEFWGRTFLIVGSPISGFHRAFDRVEPPRPVVHYEAGQPIACWALTVCRGFRGFPYQERHPSW